MKYTRLTAASLAIAALTLAACKGDTGKQDSLAKDSALAANLALASADSAAKVKPADTALSKPPKAPPVKERPRREAERPSPRHEPAAVQTTPAPTPVPAAPAPVMGSIAAGTTLTLASSNKVCTNTNAVGDNVTAVTTTSVTGSNGATIPAGATVNMTVTNLKRSENVKDNVVMEFRVVSLAFNGRSYPISASIASADVTKIRDEPKSKDVQKVAIGAGVGALAGRLLGKSTKATVIGGAAGAAVGAGAAVATANYQGCINQGASIVVRLDSPLQMVVGTN